MPFLRSEAPTKCVAQEVISREAIFRERWFQEISRGSYKLRNKKHNFSEARFKKTFYAQEMEADLVAIETRR